MCFFGLRLAALGNRAMFRLRFLAALAGVILLGAPMCAPETDHTSDDSNDPIIVGHHGTEETLLAATDTRFIIARAVYPPDSEQTGPIVRPAQLKMVSIDTATAERTPLD